MSVLRNLFLLLAFLYAATRPSSVALTDKEMILLGNFANNPVRKHSTERNIVQLSATAPVSKLLFARALVLQERDGSPSARAQPRRAYQDFLALWADADPDIGILKEARAEFAALN